MKEFKGRVSEYNQWIKEFLLNRHSYAVLVEYKFDENPNRQDQSTTWVEYLVYEYTTYTRYTWHKRRRRMWYDKRWEKPADSEVLRPYETKEFLLDPGPAY